MKINNDIHHSERVVNTVDRYIFQFVKLQALQLRSLLLEQPQTESKKPNDVSIGKGAQIYILALYLSGTYCHKTP